jgi:peptide chain release factor 1
MIQLAKIKKAQDRFCELEKLLADPEVMSEQSRYQKLAKEYSDITPLVAKYRDYEQILKQTEDLQHMLKENTDREFAELAKLELEDLKQKQEGYLKELDEILNPKTQEKGRNLIIEIRAGTGGEEASLFAADLYRMYTKYALSKGWLVESISSAPSENKGFKEVVFSISGSDAEKRLKWENGAHRVQRVPSTEASGRIHTSAATVAVLFEPEEVDVQIETKDLKIDVYRSSGPGGQSVNTTDSAVRITHIPTGTVVACQDERSQLKNRAKAMRILRARIQDKIQQEHFEKTTKDRKLKVGSGDRSEKIRTYNFPDRRVTDHRIGFTSHQLMSILEGEMDELTNALIHADEEEKSKEGNVS